MKQKQYSPLSVAQMALSLFAVNEGFLDDVTVAKVNDYEAALHDFAKANHGDVLDSINASGDYNDDVVAALKSICDGFAEKGAY
jgi:F-type H+-transporting ATPase subunit alpha